MKDSANPPSIVFGWRRLYTEACLMHSSIDCIAASECNSQSFWKKSVGRLDHAIVIAGAPGDGRLDLILDTIQKIQQTHLPTQIRNEDGQSHLNDSLLRPREVSLRVNSHHEIPLLSRPPSFSTFQSVSSLSPFVLRGHASHWPAVADGRWSSKSYFKEIAGQGRIVPVEVGADYRTDSWTQKMMDWESFLDYLWPSETGGSSSGEVIYLAQHNLFKQFPELSADIVKPDYVYCSLDPPEFFPHYKPPSNDDQLVSNVWLGPAGTVSPAHTDPYFNVYVQVVGHKTVWLAPPTAQVAMSAFPDPSSSSSSNPAQNHENPSMSNTSRLDIFAASDCDADGMIEFRRDVVPHAMSSVLGPGDMLFFPPGWWHAMRSEAVSFSVSMWF
ncbi:Clavaminate synthase-like protein [Schizopora paradoxa]|uniref:Clavaminate synthase-like protein n=1 Tax=Schizopora paradoxa TaxID=27342 RepID=A0A0H2SAR2_9AGAM|nr:Clavaminate synthase-like protein [Schizopora paradoxa]